MNRRLLAATLALTLPLAAFAQSEKSADASTAAEKHAKVVGELDALGEKAGSHHGGRATFPAGTDCSTLLTRTDMYDCQQQFFQLRIIHLQNVSQQNDANEILVAVRNMFDPGIKVYLIASTDDIAVGAYPQELDRVEAFVHSLDRPHRTYRLTYTVTESDSGKRIGVAHYSFVVKSGQRTSLKQGSKVPVATGSYNASGNTSQEQFTYLDVGMNFDATLDQAGDNLTLKTKIEQSSVAEEKDIASVREPVIRQSVIDCMTSLPPGKPTMLGGMDVTGSTRHLDIEVLAEPL